jgi:hypothetical protein
MRKHRLLWMAGLLPLLAAAPAAGQQAPRLYLQDIEPKGVAPPVAAALTDLLEIEIERGGLFEVVSQQDLRRLLKVNEQQMLLGLDEGWQQRMAALARQVDAPYALAASVGEVGRATVLALRLLDVERMEVVRRVNQTLVGDQTGLIGSLRAAALALNLEQKGVAPDLSEQLIDALRIAEKPKTLFLALSPVYEVPLGHQLSDDDIVVFRPAYLGFRIDAELPIWRWLRVFASLGAGFTINAEADQETNDLSLIYEGGSDPTDFRSQGSGISVDYSSLRLPLHFGLKAAPATGRFLPYAQIGIGLSYQRYSPSAANLDLWREQPAGGCQPPFAPEQVDNLDLCLIDDLRLEPEADVSELGFDAVAAAGFEWLLSHHLGIKAEVRYQLTTLLKSDAKLRVRFNGEAETPSGREEFHKLLGVKSLYQGLAFSAGLVVYW